MRVEILERKLCHDGFFQLERFTLRHELFAGGMSPSLHRELFRRDHAVAALLYDPQLDSVVLIEQFRIGALERDAGAWMLETIAGIVEVDETFEDVVRREAVEEAGCTAGELIRLYDFYPAPGGSSERITLYLARTDASGAGGIHGLDHEGEDIKVHVLTLEEALTAIQSGQVDSSYTIMALQWLAMNQDSIQQRWR
ncbi:MAG: NUDIX domain-containing protein [Proteobacteria bacterium]|nr:MAG: NUDIX domain-containing protein [Pseudomonadota bacterium]QKK12748.1 MAG: NUDIX domain-containing protein [Pseudomonadota bacterium]